MLPLTRPPIPAAFVLALLAGCATARAPALRWIGEFTRPTAAEYPLLGSQSARFGSLSGLTRDAASGQWVGVSDDREGSRVAWITIDLAGDRLSVSPTRMVALRPGPGIAERIATESDLEAIVALPDGTFLMAEEGHVRNGEVWQPALLHVTRDGLVTSTTPFPPAFAIADDPAQGVRDNQGIESLTRTPSGRVIAGLEQPLKGDEAGRLVAFDERDGRWQAGREWRYEIAPTPRVEGFPDLCGGGENGLVELLALSDTRLIAMERGCLFDAARRTATNPVQLFIVDLIGAVARKTSMLNLSSMTPKLSPALERLENFEALAFGPPLANGRRTLLVVSDDNFNASQKTSFLLFELTR
jgi:hypothetical protein